MQLLPFKTGIMIPVAAVVLVSGVTAAVLNFSGGEAALNPDEAIELDPSISEIIADDRARMGLSEDPEAVSIAIEPEPPSLEPVIRLETLVVASGDTLMDLAVRAGAPGDQAHAAIARLSEAFDPRRLQIGQEITLQLEEQAGNVHLAALSLRPDVTSEVWVTAEPDGVYAVEEYKTELEVQYAAGHGTIDGSLYQATLRAGVPDEILFEMIRVYSYEVDFQRDIRAGDAFQVLYERELRPDGTFARTRDVLFASLTLGGKPRKFYRFETDDGIVDYFDSQGRSVRKALMRTPIDGARMSSAFGMRK
ncbi:MAG: hypothetical protein AAGC83_04175, partial [Pseudomonadota bacterium]